MTRRSTFARLAVAGLGTLALVAGAAAPGRAQPPPDARQRVVLPAAGRDKVLHEMRAMLQAVNGVLHAVVTGDLAAAEKAARAAGMVTAADVDPQVMGSLPPPFRQLGMQTHKGFDELADRLRGGGTRDDAIRDLSAITGRCVACHAIYRLDEAR